MVVEDARDRILRALKAELRKHRGEISRIDREIGHSDGYLSKACLGKWSIGLDVLLQALQALHIDPAAFFGRALDIPHDSADYLAELETEDARKHRALRKMEETARRLASRPETAEAPPDSLDAGALVAALAGCTRREQRRRLRTAQKYRHPAFARAYLEHLDALRYEDPQEAAKLAETAAADLIPHLRAPRAEQLTLLCLAIGVFASAHRYIGKVPVATRAVRVALELARRYGLDLATADLLERGAYVLGSHGQYKRALVLLREAQEIYSDRGLPACCGRILVGRGIMLGQSGRHDFAAAVFKQALAALPEQEALARWRSAAYHGIAISYRQLGELQSAVDWLEQAIASSGSMGVINRAKLVWLQGSIHFDSRSYRQAQQAFCRTRQMLGDKDPFESALVCLDEARALLAQGDVADVQQLAKEMATMLAPFKDNKVAEAALLRFIRQSLEGRVTQALIDSTGKQLEQGRARGGHAP